MEPGKKANDNRRLHCVALDLEMLSDFEVYLTVGFAVFAMQYFLLALVELLIPTLLYICDCTAGTR